MLPKLSHAEIDRRVFCATCKLPRNLNGGEYLVCDNPDCANGIFSQPLRTGVTRRQRAGAIRRHRRLEAMAKIPAAEFTGKRVEWRWIVRVAGRPADYALAHRCGLTVRWDYVPKDAAHIVARMSIGQREVLRVLKPVAVVF